MTEAGVSPSISPGHVLEFWRTAGPDRWFTKDSAFDAEVRKRFERLWEAAREGKLATWRHTDEGALALVIVLDQFPRNMFRDDARAFSTDAAALDIAQCAIEEGRDARIDRDLVAFLYLPFMHSEALADQERCVALFRQHGDPENLKYAEIHADIIRRFGRFPHRNTALGRITSDAEKAFLDSGGFAG
jgi:uncharacterized protein (DUF924 family)